MKTKNRNIKIRPLRVLGPLVFLLICFSCDIHKESQKSKTDSSANSDLQEQIETTTKRKGDSVTYIVPRIQYKDTVIYTYSRQGTVIKTHYDKSGKIYQVDCNASAIDELRKEIRSLKQASEQSTKDKKSEKTEKVNPLFLLYGAIALVIIVIVGLFLIYKLIDKKTAALNIPK